MLAAARHGNNRLQVGSICVAARGVAGGSACGTQRGIEASLRRLREGLLGCSSSSRAGTGQQRPVPRARIRKQRRAPPLRCRLRCRGGARAVGRRAGGCQPGRVPHRPRLVRIRMLRCAFAAVAQAARPAAPPGEEHARARERRGVARAGDRCHVSAAQALQAARPGRVAAGGTQPQLAGGAAGAQREDGAC